MSGVWTTTRIRQEIDRLADWRGRLTAALTFAASQLDAVGLVPEDELVSDLTNYRQRLRTVALQITGHMPGADERLSLELLEGQLQKSQLREALIQQLDGIAELHHIDLADYAPLDRCRADANRCQQRLVSCLVPEDAEQSRLLAHEHALQAVLVLTDPRVDLADDEWNTLQERVATVYGRAFAVALVRGKIRRRAVLPSSSEPASPVATPDAGSVPMSPEPPPAADATPEDLPSIHALAGSHIRSTVALQLSENGDHRTSALSRVTDDPGDHSVRWFTSGSSILPGVAKSENRAEPAADSTPATPDEKPFDPTVPPVIIDLDLPKPLRHNDAAAKLARELAAENPRTVPRLCGLVRQLLRDNRVALAAHLARCGERLPSGRGMTPAAGLLRSLALGKSLSYARGELARAVELELKPFVSAVHTTSASDDELLGLGFLLRAAALLPALLGASSSASTVLRSFAIEPGLSHLYNYCSRVAAFGERLQSQAVELFQAPAEQSQWLAERKQLQTEVRDWLQRSVKRGLTYQRSSPLFLHAHWTVMASPTQRHPHAVMEWAKWQEVLLLTQRMLAPIANGTAQRNDVRAELTRATAMVQPDRMESIVPKPNAARGSLPITQKMQELLLESIDLSNRWLRLESSTPTRGLHLAPQQAEELRAELLERTSGVVAELDVIARTRSADLVQTGVCCCRRVVEHIRRLCAGEEPLALHEPDAKHVLFGEFLLMPHIELDENWQPMGEAAEQEQAILEHLSTGWMDWSAAFALQCHQEDHLATTRLLEMPIWPEQRVLQELHRVRGVELHRTRLAVVRELDELASQVALDRTDRPDLEIPQAEINERLERLRVAMPQVLSFGQIRRRLERYREQWRRVVAGDVAYRDRGATPSEEDSGILASLTAAVQAAEAGANSQDKSAAENWVFLEE